MLMWWVMGFEAAIAQVEGIFTSVAIAPVLQTTFEIVDAIIRS